MEFQIQTSDKGFVVVVDNEVVEMIPGKMRVWESRVGADRFIQTMIEKYGGTKKKSD